MGAASWSASLLMCKTAQTAPGSERQQAGQKPNCLIDPQCCGIPCSARPTRKPFDGIWCWLCFRPHAGFKSEHYWFGMLAFLWFRCNCWSFPGDFGLVSGILLISNKGLYKISQLRMLSGWFIPPSVSPRHVTEWFHLHNGPNMSFLIEHFLQLPVTKF